MKATDCGKVQIVPENIRFKPREQDGSFFNSKILNGFFYDTVNHDKGNDILSYCPSKVTAKSWS